MKLKDYTGKYTLKQAHLCCLQSVLNCTTTSQKMS